MEYGTAAMLLIAGIISGAINSLAGGGSFVSYPALLFAGLSPISANVTNTLACTPGYMVGAFALRRELMRNPAASLRYVIASALGGLGGALLLLSIDGKEFEAAVPWLLLLASFLFVFGGAIYRYLLQKFALEQGGGLKTKALLFAAMLAVAFYGGFFNAGFGILLLAFAALAGLEDVHEMNGVKLLASSCGSLIAVAIFAFSGQINWLFGFVTLCGTLLGGYYSVMIGRLIPQAVLRVAIASFSFAITIYFFWKVYG